jgi:hypothetical protein
MLSEQRNIQTKRAKEHLGLVKEYGDKIPAKRIEYYKGEVAAALSFPHLRVAFLEKDIRKSQTSKKFWICFIIAILNEIPEGKGLKENQIRKFIREKILFPYGY